MKMITSSAIAAVLLSLSACSPSASNAELDEAKKKIASLEAELALEKAKNPSSSVTASASSAAVASSTAVAEAAPTGKQWHYDASEDKMDGATTYYAHVYSTNSVNFSFPYSGEQNATLTLRSGKRQGRDVMFSIRKGQILCHSYQDCTVLVRFDDEKAVNYPAVGAADNSSETIFLRNYDKFVAKLKKAKRVRISIDIYHQGAPVFEFDVSGFDGEKYQPKNS
ncbi:MULTISPECIES: hypothetical protein [unclassified Janthinobacterium]|uniref:hypothetical protein n=1 Tax=unclassified Janthinobacterium TaxID=2610881 RepID=UPI00160A40CC|nr:MULTISPECIES: hypothetical protein [unclassified Janthinobacterium]MBB5609336.1 hypothetical protein [Janthinobacterium sp. S3T4]MBB5614509.1 hypothetical protein [Janthinobacterium sp. S3M3]